MVERLARIRWGAVAYVLLCWAPLPISVSWAAVYQWSQTASSNASADPSVNWREGQPPSSVNDSARAMMAAVAKYRDDIAGANVTTGTSTAYSLTSNSGFSSLALLNNQAVAFTPNVTSGVAPTLNVDGLGNIPLQTSPGVAVGAGTLVQGTPYVAVYNNSNQAFYLTGYFGNSFNVPIGAGMWYVASTPPNSNFVLPFGQPVSRTTYSALFSLVGTTFGTGDGSTTFNLPDLRGSFIAGLDNMGGTPKNRIGSVVTDTGTIVGTTLNSAGGSTSHALALGETPSFSYTPSGSVGNPVGYTGALSTTNVNAPGSGANVPAGGAGVIGSLTFTGNPATLGGSNGAHAIMPPTTMLYYLLRII